MAGDIGRTIVKGDIGGWRARETSKGFGSKGEERALSLKVAGLNGEVASDVDENEVCRVRKGVG